MKKYLYLIIKFISLLIFCLVYSVFAFANQNELIKNNNSPSIKETNLVFTIPLKERKITKWIVIHHSAELTKDNEALNAYHLLHLKRNFGGYGYHYLIRKDGIIERGRPENVMGRHCLGEKVKDKNGEFYVNKESIGICLNGNFMIEEPTIDQINSLIKLCIYLYQKYKVAIADVVPHCQLGNSKCCGTNLLNKLPAIKKEIQKQLLSAK